MLARASSMGRGTGVILKENYTQDTGPGCRTEGQIWRFSVRQKVREVVKKKNGYFTVRLTVRVDPPPLRSAVL